ncbi:MAG: hypothetical protein NTV38_11200 [Chloroflexi bacterium]|nr:hypothetical protein [Chloroflexota bacterium]
MKKLTYLFHGFLFAAGSAVILYVTNSDSIIDIPPSDVLYPTIFSVVVFLLITLIGYLLTRNLEAAGLIASFLVLGFFYIWPIFVGILISTLISLLLIKLIIKRVGFGNTTLILNAISIVVVCYYLFQFISLIVGVPLVSYQTTIQPIREIPGSFSSLKTTPDIYYIILDGYGRADMLQAVHGYNNSAFVDGLEQRGFIVASRSQANYPRTLLSLSSSLNMQYLDTMSSVMGDSYSWWPVTGAIQQSEVRKVLQNWGYKTVFFASDWDYTDIRDGDFYEAPFPVMLKNFENPFLNFTNLSILRSIDRFGIAFPSYDTHRQIILYSFNMLPEVAAIPGPKFVFDHIVAPHPPFVFDRTGNPVDPDYPYSFIDPYKQRGDISESRNGYLDQLMFINQEILTTVDGILANSNIPPIIILQADHGPGFFLDNNSIENSCLYERFSILNAYYLPGVERNSVPMDLSPVNSFRFIFNQYFQTKLEILPNRQYFSTNVNFYQFTDVTGQTQSTCKANSDGLP